MSYKNFLQKKVDQARAQVSTGHYLSNEEVTTAFQQLRNSLLTGSNSAPTKVVNSKYFDHLRIRVIATTSNRT